MNFKIIATNELSTEQQIIKALHKKLLAANLKLGRSPEILAQAKKVDNSVQKIGEDFTFYLFQVFPTIFLDVIIQNNQIGGYIIHQLEDSTIFPKLQMFEKKSQAANQLSYAYAKRLYFLIDKVSAFKKSANAIIESDQIISAPQLEKRAHNKYKVLDPMIISEITDLLSEKIEFGDTLDDGDIAIIENKEFPGFVSFGNSATFYMKKLSQYIPAKLEPLDDTADISSKQRDLLAQLVDDDSNLTELETIALFQGNHIQIDLTNSILGIT
jgi:hypothetical protein